MQGRQKQARPVIRGLLTVVLAAGGGSRFGGRKPLARIAGKALVRRAAECAPAGPGSELIVISGAQHSAIRACLTGLPARVVRNLRWRQGLASSLRCALQAVRSPAQAVLLLPVDLPLLAAADLQALARAWRRAPRRPAAAAFAGGLGAPAIFPRCYWPLLRQLRGDRGARTLLAALPGVQGVPLPAAAHDVDTPAELAAIVRQAATRRAG